MTDKPDAVAEVSSWVVGLLVCRPAKLARLVNLALCTRPIAPDAPKCVGEVALSTTLDTQSETAKP